MNSEPGLPHDLPTEHLRVWHIQPLSPSVAGQVKALWRYRFLFWPFTLHALFSVYKNTILGIAWMVIRPLILAVGAAFVVGKVFGISVDPIPLPLFILIGLGAWTLLRRNVMDLTKSLLKSRALLQQVFVPPLLLSIAALSPGVFQFTVVLALVAALLFYYGPVQGVFYADFGLQTLALIPAVLLTMLVAVALGCFTALLNAMARDTQLSLRYILGSWMLATPVLYPATVVPEEYRWIMYLNPMAPVVELYRWAILGYGTIHLEFLALSVMMILLGLVLGIWFFAVCQNRLFDHL